MSTVYLAPARRGDAGAKVASFLRVLQVPLTLLPVGPEITAPAATAAEATGSEKVIFIFLVNGTCVAPFLGNVATTITGVAMALARLPGTSVVNVHWVSVRLILPLESVR